MSCDENDLKSRTEEYWNIRSRSDAIQYYINDLLPREIECAKEREGAWPAEAAEVLVLLVGFSIEPLLQAVCAYQPEEVVLILNETYSEMNGTAFAKERVLPWLRRLSPTLLPQLVKERPQPLQRDAPDAVFQSLLKELRYDSSRGRQIVIDITGGKKSMVAGAFLFAAYTGARISYVDFDEYHEDRRRPYGYSCRIGFLPNPYEQFALRDWERARQLYERFSFDAAAEQLGSITRAMPKEYFNSEQIGAVELMRLTTLSYHAWSNGDYFSAKSLGDSVAQTKASYQPLNSVESLWETWPKGAQSNKPSEVIKKLLDELSDLESSDFYADSAKFLIYARDESTKVEQIVRYKEDYRSGLLRAMGLSEVLLKARLVLLKTKGWLTLQGKDGGHLAPQMEFKVIVDGLSAKQMQDILDAPEGHSIQLTVELEGKQWQILFSKSSEAPRLKIQSRDKAGTSDVGLKRFRYLRNKVTHAVLPIPKEIAEAAVRMMRANLRDYEDNWAKLIRDDLSSGTPPTWSKLCEWFGIDFLPTYQHEEET